MRISHDTDIDATADDEPVEPEEFTEPWAELIRSGRSRLLIIMLILALLAIKPAMGVFHQSGASGVFGVFVAVIVLTRVLPRFGWMGTLGSIAIVVAWVQSEITAGNW